MRTLLASAAVAGALIAGIGPAAADVPVANQVAGSSDLGSGSASTSGSASMAGGIWNFLCSLGPCTYTPPVVH